MLNSVAMKLGLELLNKGTLELNNCVYNYIYCKRNTEILENKCIGDYIFIDLDTSNTKNLFDEKLRNFKKLQKDLLSTIFFNTKNDLRWNIYLIFLIDDDYNSLSGLPINNVITDDDFARKIFISYSNIKYIFTCNKITETCSDNKLMTLNNILRNKLIFLLNHLAINNLLSPTTPKELPTTTIQTLATRNKCRHMKNIDLTNTRFADTKKMLLSQINVILGSSGAGKSLLLNEISRQGYEKNNITHKYFSFDAMKNLLDHLLTDNGVLATKRKNTKLREKLINALSERNSMMSTLMLIKNWVQVVNAEPLEFNLQELNKILSELGLRSSKFSSYSFEHEYSRINAIHETMSMIEQHILTIRKTMHIITPFNYKKIKTTIKGLEEDLQLCNKRLYELSIEKRTLMEYSHKLITTHDMLKTVKQIKESEYKQVNDVCLSWRDCKTSLNLHKKFQLMQSIINTLQDNDSNPNNNLKTLFDAVSDIDKLLKNEVKNINILDKKSLTIADYDEFEKYLFRKLSDLSTDNIQLERQIKSLEYKLSVIEKKNERITDGPLIEELNSITSHLNKLYELFSAIDAIQEFFLIDDEMDLLLWIDRYELAKNTCQMAINKYKIINDIFKSDQYAKKLRSQLNFLNQDIKQCITALRSYEKEPWIGDLLKNFFDNNHEVIKFILMALEAEKDIDYISIEKNKFKVKTSCTEYTYDQMSSGQKHNLLLAIFISLHIVMPDAPNFIILDEPTAHMDDMQTLSLIDLLRELALSGFQIIVATSRPELAGLFRRKFSFFGKNFKLIRISKSTDNLTSIKAFQYNYLSEAENEM